MVDVCPSILSNAGPSSQEDYCPICYGNLDLSRKAFVDTCMHSFCLDCISRWGRDRPHCPLCNATFDRILHSVQSDASYTIMVLETKAPLAEDLSDTDEEDEEEEEGEENDLETTAEDEDEETVGSMLDDAMQVVAQLFGSSSDVSSTDDEDDGQCCSECGREMEGENENVEHHDSDY